ncbi:MAG: reverse transcriptase domain-containing protein [Acidobacteriota bacterium]
MAASKRPLLECQNREQLAELLEVDISTLTYFAYGGGRKYKSFSIPKKSGGVRRISAPVGGLKEIQRKLASHLTEIYPNPVYVHGFIAHRSVVTNATPHLNKKHVFNIDLKDYFPSITSNRIIGLLRSKPFNFNDQVASTIAGLTCSEGSLPQGAPTSPILANMIALRMDKALRKLCKRDHVSYSRYADDLTFSSSRSLPKSILLIDEDTGAVLVGDELREIITDNYFKINPAKTRLSRNGQAKYVTGVKVNASPNLSRKYIRQIKNMLHAWEKWGTDRAQQEFKDKFGGENRKFQNVLWGKIAYLKSIKGNNDLTYAKLYNKFVELEGEGKPQIPITELERLHGMVYVIKSDAEQGTAFLLNSRWFLTCGHVVASDSTENFYFPYDRWSPYDRKRFTAIDETRSSKDEFDIITLSFDSEDERMVNNSFELAPDNFQVEVNMEFRVVGFPAYRSGFKPHVLPVKVVAINQNGSYMHAYVDQKLSGGLSGSPVIDSNNRLVGVVQRGEEATTLDNTFLPIQELRKYISSLET